MSVAISPGEVAPLEANAPAREKLMLLLIFLLGGILRLIGANNEFWYDEIVTIQLYVRKPLHQALTTYIANNHVLNSILAHLAASLHPTQPEQPWLIRLPAILFGIFTVPAFYYLVRQLWPGRIALLGTLLLAVSYPHVYYTQQARGYSAFIFFAVMACGLLLRMESAGASRGASWRGAAYALCIALGAYAQLLMVFVIAGQGMAFLLRQRWRALAWLAAGCALAGVLYLPMLAAVREYYATHKHDTGVPFFSRAFVGELKPVLPMLILGLIFGPLVLWRMWKRNALAALVLLVPLALNIIIPAARGEGVHPRSLIYALPIAYLFVMEAIDWTGRRLRWAPVAITLLLAALNLVVLAMYYPLPKQGFQAALRYV
ncbi:MAG TPA: glycosyltransferase family 39 protein, partial [Tepidisphaeraceae bacterium]